MPLLAITSVFHTAQYSPLGWVMLQCVSISLQGFIEMEDKDTATTFLNYYSHVTPTVRYSEVEYWGFSVFDFLNSLKLGLLAMQVIL